MLIAKTAHVPAPHHDAPVLAELDNYINAASPEIVYWLVHTWNDQQQATTYKELQAAVASGCQDQLEQWQEDYANLVNAQLKPIWLAAMQTAAVRRTSAGKRADRRQRRRSAAKKWSIFMIDLLFHSGVACEYGIPVSAFRYR